MKRLLFFLSLSILALSTNAQSISRSSICSYGSVAKAGSHSLSATLGQTSAATFSAANHFLTQGFEQPRLLNVGFVELISSSEVKVYPVPSYDRVTVELQGKKLDDFQIMMVDMSGKTINPQLLFEERQGANIVSYNVQGLASGVYHLVFTQKDNQKRITARILKME